MNTVLLSGGSGKRLWPLSNDIRSKQFIKLFKLEDGTYESMAQRVYRQIKEVDPNAQITVATSKNQVSALHSQLGLDVGICVEPCRKDTFPAIVLAAAYLHDIKSVPENEVITVCPVDPYVQKEYFESFKDLENVIKDEEANLALLGIQPTEPSEKYGYIIPVDKERISNVSEFKEKPNYLAAQEYIKNGALWNAGVFSFRISYILERAQEVFGFSSFDELYSNYNRLPKVSFDYAVAEKENNIKVLRYNGLWGDLGTWDAFTETMDDQALGKVIIDQGCNNIRVLNELDVPIMCVGLDNMIIAASPEGVLISDRTKSGNIKHLVDKIDQQIMFAEKSWGSFKVIDVEEESLTIKVTLRPGHRMNYHSHEHRNEIWTVANGSGKAIVDDVEVNLTSGDSIQLAAGSRHTLIANTELTVIEVQIGRDISVEDKIKYIFPLIPS